MQRVEFHFMAAAVLVVAAICTQALATSGEQEPRCEKEVRDYLQAMQFIRTTAGASIGDRVAAGVASEENVQKIVRQQGYCVAARYIRERTAKR